MIASVAVNAQSVNHPWAVGLSAGTKMYRGDLGNGFFKFNDGNIKYDANTDGASQALASCTFDIRNLPDLAHARIIYTNYTLTINIATTHDANGHPVFTPCLQVEEVDLGVDKYFGLTAHTGDVADNHDVYDFLVKDLSPDDVDLE